jgi:hypothetical protein
MKTKNAGSTQRWLGFLREQYIFPAAVVFEHFFFSPISNYLKTEPASGNPTEVLRFTFILWELYFKLYRITGQAKTV